jgi:iron complex outermembrane receptor protein
MSIRLFARCCAACATSAVAISVVVNGAAAQEVLAPRNQGATLPPITVETSQAPKRKPKRAAVRPAARAAATSSQPARANAPAAPVIERGTGFGTRTADSAGKGYAMPDATTATRMNGRVFETPYSIQTVPSDVIRDQAVTTINDALKNVSGVQIDREGIYDGITLRGFAQNSGNRWIYRDGSPFQNSKFDFANIDRIEVLKGTAGGIYGRIDPGGLINVVTKKPLATPHYSIEQWVSNLGYRTVGDATGSLTQDGSVRYRAIGAFEDRDSFRDFVDSRNVLLSPSISWDITPTTELYLNYEYRRMEQVFDLGIPVYNNVIPDVPRNRFIGLKDQPPSVVESHLVDAILTQQLAEGWTAKVRGTYSKSKTHSFDSEPGGSMVAPGFTNIYYGEFIGTFESHFVEASITGDTQITQDIRNRLFASAESYHSAQNYGFNGTTDPAIVRPLSIENPVYQSWREVAGLPLTMGGRPFTEWRAVSFQDQVTLFDRLDLIAGGRWDGSNAGSASCALSGGATTCPPSTPIDAKTFNVFKPRAGINFRVTPEVALFTSYSESFGPIVGFGRLLDGSLPDPSEAKQYEAGAKFQTSDGRLNATVAAYDLTRTNLVNPIPGNPNFVNQIGEARSRGVEVDVSGNLTDRLQVMANYAYTDARITVDTTDAGGVGNTGHRLYNVPLHQGGIWLQYSLPSGWRFGGGAFAGSNRWGNNENTFRIGDYVRVDTSAAYSWDTGFGRATASFNVQNLFDERYYVSATYVPAVLPAPGRTFIARLRFEH